MRSQLLSYVTFGLEPKPDDLLTAVKTQVGQWEKKMNVKAQIQTGRSKGGFKVFVVFPLDAGQNFPAAIWEDPLPETLDENITLDDA